MFPISPLFGMAEKVTKPFSQSGRRKARCDARFIHTSRLVREAASRLMYSRKGHILNFFQQWVYKRPTWKGHQSGTYGVLTCIQHNVDVTAGLQYSCNVDPQYLQTTILTRIHSSRCGFEWRVMTHRHSYASRLMRETASRHMIEERPHIIFSALGIQTAHQEPTTYNNGTMQPVH